MGISPWIFILVLQKYPSIRNRGWSEVLFPSTPYWQQGLYLVIVQRGKQPSLTTARDTAAFLLFFVQIDVLYFLRCFQWIHLVVHFQDGLAYKNTFLLVLASWVELLKCNDHEYHHYNSTVTSLCEWRICFCWMKHLWSFKIALLRSSAAVSHIL